MTLFIKNSNGWVAHSGDVNELLGLGRKGKLPPEGMPAREIQGIKVWVNPIAHGRFALRVRAQCPACSLIMAAGRLHQHSKVHG